MEFLTGAAASLRPFVMDVLNLTIWLLLLSAIFIPLERFWAVRQLPIARKAILVDLVYYFLNSLLPNLLLVLPVAVLAWGAHRLVPDSVVAFTTSLPAGWRFLAALVVGEFGCYWGHRWLHEIPALWRIHSVHHSAEDVDWLVSTRAHPLDLVLTRLAGLIPLYILGLAQPTRNPADTLSIAVVLFGTVWQFFIHANIRWRFGWLEYLFVTPAFHHWHHTRAEPINRNYATVLPWMDALFGTFHLPRRAWPSTYGIEDKMPEDLAGQLMHPIGRGKAR